MTVPEGEGEAPVWAQLSEPEAEGLLEVVQLLEQTGPRLADFAREAVRQLPELRAIWDPDDPAQPARTRRRLEELRQAAQARHLGPYLAHVQRVARELSEQGVAFTTLVAVLSRFVPLLQEMVIEHFGPDPPRLRRALAGIHRWNTAVLAAAGAEYTEVRRAVIEQEYQRVVRELSVPVVPVWRGVLVVPLVGALDSQRARQMTQSLLEAVASRRARVVILDVTGVPSMDTQVADSLMRAVRAARLLGTRSVLVGIQPPIAQTLVRMGVDLREVHTEADLESGLKFAFRKLGYRIVRETARG